MPATARPLPGERATRRPPLTARGPPGSGAPHSTRPRRRRSGKPSAEGKGQDAGARRPTTDGLKKRNGPPDVRAAAPGPHPADTRPRGHPPRSRRTVPLPLGAERPRGPGEDEAPESGRARPRRRRGQRGPGGGHGQTRASPAAREPRPEGRPPSAPRGPRRARARPYDRAGKRA